MARPKSEKKSEPAPAERFRSATGLPAQAQTPPAAKKAPVDINSDSPAELKAVTGSEADAKKIVENRPYQSTDELAQKKVMPKATYDKIKNQIVAK
jgi:competence protein ComEA